jgi:hypothetical protein
MATQKKSVRKDAKTGQFVLGRDAFAKIAAVDGIRLTDAMEKRAEESETKGLSAGEYRSLIISSHDSKR